MRCLRRAHIRDTVTEHRPDLSVELDLRLCSDRDMRVLTPNPHPHNLLGLEPLVVLLSTTRGSTWPPSSLKIDTNRDRGLSSLGADVSVPVGGDLLRIQQYVFVPFIKKTHCAASQGSSRLGWIVRIPLRTPRSRQSSGGIVSSEAPSVCPRWYV